MFSKILSWIRDWINKMIGQSSVKQALKIDIAVSAPMAEALQMWSLMYENKSSWLTTDIKSLNLPASIAGEIARAVTIEMKASISGSVRADYLAAQVGKIMPKLRQMVEYGCAKGGLMMKPYVNGDEIDVDFIQADQFFPVKFDANGNITACVFADQRTVGNNFYTRLEYHTMVDMVDPTNGKKSKACEIKNLAFKSTGKETLGNEVSLASSIPEWAGLQPQALIKNLTRPLFAYFRFPQANNIDPTSPLGVSCYARATELIEQADKLWSNLLWEFESGKRAIYIDSQAFDKDTTTGKPILRDKRLYRPLIATGNIDDAQFFKDWSPEFREASILSGLDAILKKIEFTCGIAYGTISDPQTEAKTATEITIAKQRTYATITDTQKALQSALDQLLWSMDQWVTIYQLAPAGTFQTVYEFDDSVVVDHDAQFTQDSRSVGMGAMSLVEFRMRNYGEDEATATKKVAMAKAEQPEDMFANQGA
jgi:A118 family predicted phage portal protein